MTQEAGRGEPVGSRSLRLTITTPNVLLVDEQGVLCVRAEDETGGFGILPGHAEFLTVLPACVVRWRNASGLEAYCALHGGVLTASRGERVSIACRQGVLGQDLQKLEADARRARAERLDAAARAKVEQTRLHARTVRQLIRYLHPSGAAPEAVLFSEEEEGL
jgi:F-type H+-transporting ATPase subunit epsilon